MIDVRNRTIAILASAIAILGGRTVPVEAAEHWVNPGPPPAEEKPVSAPPAAPAAPAAKLKEYTKSKNFDDLTHAEHTAAKAEARNRKLKVLRVCADGGNMPMSNNKGEGYQNKLIETLVADLGGTVSYFWRPYHERGITRETFENNECDVLLDIPATLTTFLTTEPIYRSTYVFATRTDRNIEFKGLDDPEIGKLRVGVFQHSGLREALVRRGFGNLVLHVISYDTDLRPETQPWTQVQQVVDGTLDVAAVWGPFAGWLPKMKGEPVKIQPVNMMEDKVPLEFDLAIGMRQNDVLLKYMLDWALLRKQKEVAQILADYGVPLVQCSRCTVQGDLPSNGAIYQKLRSVSTDRYLKQEAPKGHTKDTTADQIVTTERVETWLKEGADLNAELMNAITGNDPARVTLLIDKGADVNKPDNGGMLPIQNAARNRNAPLVELLAGKGADVNKKDNDGFTALLNAINRNHVPTIEMLAKKGADLELATPQGITPLTWAIGDGKLFAAKALIDVGANVNSTSGYENVTPLMTVATQLAAKTRAGFIASGPAPVEIGEMLISKGANVNALSKDGVSALMIAAGHDNAPMIGLLLRAGADANLKNSSGQTALDIAKLADHTAAIGAFKVLVTAPAKPASAPAQN